MNKIIFLSLLGFIAGTGLASAQSGMAGSPGNEDTVRFEGRGHRGGADHEQRRAQFLAEADTNQDGTLSKAEKQAFHEAHAKARFAKKDENGDGRLSKDELPRMPEEWFAKLDTDQDGALSADEMKAGFRGHRGHGRGMHHGKGHFAAKMFERVDANSDDRITRDEMRASADKHFSRMDKNSDGVITRDEIAAGHHFGKNKGKRSTQNKDLRRGARVGKHSANQQAKR